jgi:hypothetical protein
MTDSLMAILGRLKAAVGSRYYLPVGIGKVVVGMMFKKKKKKKKKTCILSFPPH